MRKHSPIHIVDPPSTTSLPSRVPWRRVLLTLVISPLLYEASLLIVAKWARLTGRSILVKTPVLDTVAAYRNQARLAINRVFSTGDWNPELVVPVMAAVFLLTAKFLKTK